MRCGCPQCGTYMIQSESLDLGCVCPDCLYRCRACMGTNTVVSREDLKNIVFVDRTVPQDDEGTPTRPEPLRPEELID